MARSRLRPTRSLRDHPVRGGRAARWPSARLMATAGIPGWLANLPKKRPSWLLKMMAPTAPASATRLTFSSNVMSPRSISAILAIESVGRNVVLERAVHVGQQAGGDPVDGRRDRDRPRRLGRVACGQHQIHLRDRERDAELLYRRLVSEVAEPASQVLVRPTSSSSVALSRGLYSSVNCLSVSNTSSASTLGGYRRVSRGGSGKRRLRGHHRHRGR